jgi:hypothetical protein
MERESRGSTGWTRRAAVTAALAAIAIGGASVSEAWAACAPTPGAPSAGLKAYVDAPTLPFSPNSALRPTVSQRDDPNDIVGLWFTTFRLNDDAKTVWNRGFQQYHADKTELSVDNSVPPALGNVCIGVWKAVGPRTIKLRHVTWNWNPDGTPAGTFLLLTTVKLDARGNAYAGVFESDSFDLAHNKIPELHFEGTVRAVRITVD